METRTIGLAELMPEGRVSTTSSLDAAVSAVEQSIKPVPVCRHFTRTGSCLYSDACKFRHEQPQQDAGPAASRRTWGGKRRVVRKCGKAGALRRFVLETFGEERLRQGSGVLDVAGGQGELAFQLVNLNGITTTVVDPRPLRVDRFSKKLRWGVYHDTAPLQVFNSQPRPVSDDVDLFPGHLRAFLEQALLDPLHAGDRPGFTEALYDSCLRARQIDWTRKGIVGIGAEAEKPGDVADAPREVFSGASGRAVFQEVTGREAFGAEGDMLEDLGGEPVGEKETTVEQRKHWEPPDAGEVEALLRGLSCIVGLHPDQAAGAALDIALMLGIPVAVVPCCVYAVEFPSRRLADGRPVRSHEELREWLLAKDPRLREAQLPFEGRNHVIYFDPTWE